MTRPRFLPAIHTRLARALRRTGYWLRANGLGLAMCCVVISLWIFFVPNGFTLWLTLLVIAAPIARQAWRADDAFDINWPDLASELDEHDPAAPVHYPEPPQ